MSTETAHTHDETEHGEHGMTKKKIYRVLLILLGITGIEFFIALVLVPHFNANGGHAAAWANPIYIVLTLFKAFYIVGYFMHLKFEKLDMALSIVIPILFIIGLILVLTNESHYWIDLRL
jgi:cytochrome c oxidase subunit IV